MVDITGPDIVGVDYNVVNREQRVQFIDSLGGSHAAAVYMPAKVKYSRAGLPTIVYIHALGWACPMIESKSKKGCKDGLDKLMQEFVVISPLLPGFKDCDAYFDNALGSHVLAWLLELTNFVAKGWRGPDGFIVDKDRVIVSGVSLGGAASYKIAAQLATLLCCAVPVAAYHRQEKRAQLIDTLAQLPLYCVHSASEKETTCPIAIEVHLWRGIQARGGEITVKEVSCKHGDTFKHAYEVDTDVVDWMLKQRKSKNAQRKNPLRAGFDHTPFLTDAADPKLTMAAIAALVALNKPPAASTGTSLSKSGTYCKWCEIGECWSHSKTSKNHVNNVESASCQRAKPLMQIMAATSKNHASNVESASCQEANPLMQIMAAMMDMGGGDWNGGTKTGVDTTTSVTPWCKWCQKGECWDHPQPGKANKKATVRAEPYAASGSIWARPLLRP